MSLNKEHEIAEALMLEIKEYKLHTDDCWTLTCKFYQRCYDIILPTFEYGKKMDIPPDEVYKHWDIFSEREKISPGDVVTFYDSIVGLHTGVYLGFNDVMHMNQVSGIRPVGISSVDDFRHKIKYFARYKGLK